MKALERRIKRLEDTGGDDDELFDIAGIMMTGAEVQQMFKDVDGKTRGLPSEKEGFKCQAT